MLEDLPVEVLEQIIGYLPTASSIINLARTNRKLYSILASNEYAIFRDFVQRAFPTIKTPPIWRHMAKELTSRSRAWDRKSFLARECYPSVNDSSGPPWLDLSTKFGYTPVIDSYEVYGDGSANSRKEVLAYGAAGRLRLRTTQHGTVTWSTLRSDDDHLPQYDISHVHLLRPHQHRNTEGETVIIRRQNRPILKIESGPNPNNIAQVAQYATGRSLIHCMDVSDGTDAQLVVLDRTTLQLFPADSQEKVVEPSCSVTVTPKYELPHHKRCVRFLDDKRIATSVQFVQGTDRGPILIYDITPSSIVDTTLSAERSLDDSSALSTGRHTASILTKLDSSGSLAYRPGQVFLSGWTDTLVRMYDLRAGTEPISKYYDPVDNGRIRSLATFGHEKFFAGSHQNGCLKMFDLRMPGARAYSYLDAISGLDNKTNHGKEGRNPSEINSVTEHFDSLNLQAVSKTRRDVNIFLAPIVNQRGRLWEPLPPQDEKDRIRNTQGNVRGRGNRRQQNNSSSNNVTRYSGSIYSLSTPSPSSHTLFAGIENHVLQLDFINTDDIRRRFVELPCNNTSSSNVGNEHEHETETEINANSSISSNSTSKPNTIKPTQILNLSSYERPRKNHESTDTILLRKQLPWSSLCIEQDDSNNNAAGGTDKDDTHTRDERQIQTQRPTRDQTRNQDQNQKQKQKQKSYNPFNDIDATDSISEEGWDERWRLGRNWKRRED